VSIDNIKECGVFLVDEGGVRITEVRDYPALFSGKIVRSDGSIVDIDFVLVRDEGGYRLLKSDLEEIYEREYVSGVKKALEQYSTIIDDFDVDIVKAGWQLGVKRYAREPRIAGIVGYEEWEGYEGLGRDRSLELNAFLWDMAFNKRRFDLDELKREVVDGFGIDDRQAENIIRTEFANIFNKMREWAYLEKTRVKRFRWVAKADACEKCKAVESASKRGVSLEKLKELIKEHGGRYAREWSVHPQCRCSFTRARGSVEGWERV
jgi:hypothetical protein